jgi:hypothetical protein
MDIRNNSKDPLEHTANLKKEFSAIIDHLREDVTKMDDPAAKALFEVSAEVISGLNKSFIDYEKGIEPAWRSKNKDIF